MGSDLGVSLMYRDITLELIGSDGNVFSILATVRQTLRREGIDRAEIDSYLAPFLAGKVGGYDNVLAKLQEDFSVS